MRGASMEYGVHDPTGQAARLEFGNKQAVGTLWQSVTIDVVELAVIDDDAASFWAKAGSSRHAPQTSGGQWQSFGPGLGPVFIPALNTKGFQ